MMNRQTMFFFLYGPPASGKSTLARRLAQATGLDCVDLDDEIVRAAKTDIPDFFAEHGEAAFRDLEAETLANVLRNHRETGGVVALGGGTLLRAENRSLCEAAGMVICLDAPDDAELERRIASQAGSRPLGNRARERAPHYASFSHRLAQSFALEDSLVLVGKGIAEPFLAFQPAVFDETVASLYPQLAKTALTRIPSGESHKTPDTVMRLWHEFARAGLGRKDGVTACGGGVTGDLTGFAAATWMRGINWFNVPTTLLAMVDASTGGKTGCDLPEGKNLAGAFHSPKLVIIDTDFLKTLPMRELSSGRAEMLKHAIIAPKTKDAAPPLMTAIPDARQIAESLAVKVDIVRQDPRETLGKRLLLNCGHTIGHAVEAASDYALSHGEAVAIGCVEEARLAVQKGLAPASWPLELAHHAEAAGLPSKLPDGMTWNSLAERMRQDKKKQDGAILFALPCGWGDVRPVKIIV